MINIPEGGGWCGGDIRVFRLNQKKRVDAFNFCFFILRRECVGARRERVIDCVIVLFSQKLIYFWELYVSGNYKKIRLDFLAQLVRAIGC